jgi:phosphoglycerate dehydrogenase-like enzyme
VGVAEHVFLLILSLYKRLLAADAALRRGEWLQWELRSGSYELAGKTLGLLGLGRIGREVAARARAFEARVLYHDVAPAPAEVEQALNARLVPLDTLLAEADILSLHLPLTRQTRHCLGALELSQMKPTAILINTARGPLVDEAALLWALKTGRLAGAGLDVFEIEPVPVSHPLLSLPNVVLTPHIAAGTVDALVAKLDACFGNMQRLTQGQAPHDVVAG